MYLTAKQAAPAERRRTVATLAGIPGGKAGTVATLKYMRQFAREAVRSPSQEIRERALAIVGHLPARSWHSEIRALHEFVRDEIRYVRDPVGVESVATPEKTLQLRQGDCDDKSTLLAALLESIGHPARFVAVAFNGAPFSHVYVETLAGDEWIALETIIPKPTGWRPPNATARYVLKV